MQRREASSRVTTNRSGRSLLPAPITPATSAGSVMPSQQPPPPSLLPPQARRARSSGAVLGTDYHRVQQMNTQLQRINSRIERKIQEYRQESEVSHQLLSRAHRLTERLEVLKHKLRMCFDMAGRDHPPNLQQVLQQMSTAADPEDAPTEFICPITQCVMIDPVRTQDGHVYDRAAIFEWFAGFQAKGQLPTSPLTNLLLPDTSLTADHELRQKIQTFLKERQDTLPADAVLMIAPHAQAPSVPSQAPPPARPAGGPIWSSSVVPPQEANSRELNLLRMSDIEVPFPTVGMSTTAPSSASSSLVATSSFRERQRRLQEQLQLRQVMRTAERMTGVDLTSMDASVVPPAASTSPHENDGPPPAIRGTAAPVTRQLTGRTPSTSSSRRVAPDEQRNEALYLAPQVSVAPRHTSSSGLGDRGLNLNRRHGGTAGR